MLCLVHDRQGKGEVRTYWLEDEDVTIREKRARNSDDSGVNTDGPTDLSQTNAILIHKQRALHHQQQQQLELQFVRPDGGSNLRSSFRLSFKQHRRSAGDSRSLTGFTGTDGCASPGGGGGSTGGGLFPRRSKSARGYRYNHGGPDTISNATARSVSQTFGRHLGSQFTVDPGYSMADETVEQLHTPSCGAAAAVPATTLSSLRAATPPASTGITLQVPDLLTRTPEAEARENLEKRKLSAVPFRCQNPSPCSSVFASASPCIQPSSGELGKKTSGSNTNGLLVGSGLSGHEYSGHPAVKTGLWVDKHAEFHRHNTEPMLPRARNRSALYATTAGTIRAANTTSTTIADSVVASCKACNSGRSLGKKKNKCSLHDHKMPGSANKKGGGESSTGRTFSTHSPTVKRRDTGSEIQVSESVVPDTLNQACLNLMAAPTSTTDTKEEKTPKEEVAKGKEKPFHLHIFNTKKAKPKEKQINFSGAPYDSEIPQGVMGSFTPTLSSPDDRILGSQKHKVHPLLLAAQADVGCGTLMEDCPSPSRHSVTFSDDTGI